MSSATPAHGRAPEVWSLEHPRHGLLELAVGGPAALRTVDDGFPLPKRADPADEDVADAGADAEKVVNPGYVLLRDGAVVARRRQIGDHKVAIDGDPPERGELTDNVSVISGPRMQLRSSVLATAVRQVTFREGRDVVHLDPPPGSAAEARLASIAASPWKRVVYPLGAGVGKSGWAIAVIVVAPVILRLLEPVLTWIRERLPDVDIPWPDISLPSIPWPDISLPSINLPEVSVPGWVEFMLEYSKVWVPLVIGVVVGVLAVRHARRSRRTKELWAEQNAPGQGDETEHDHDEDAQPDEADTPGTPGFPDDSDLGGSDPDATDPDDTDPTGGAGPAREA